MLTRILLTLAAIGVWAGIAAGVASGQPAADLNLPAPCRAKAAEDLAALERRQQRLQRRIALARAAKPAAEEEAGGTQLSKSQAALLDVLFQIQCHKLRQQTAGAEPSAAERVAPKRRSAAPVPDAPGAPRPPAPPPPPTRRAAKKAGAAADNVIEVTTYFATNRGRSGKSGPASFYDAIVSPLSYGRALVTIPGTHTPGASSCRASGSSSSSPIRRGTSR